MSNDAFDAAQFVPVFLEECGEHLATLEGSLLDLERRPQDAELLSRLFRAAHSIKGGAAMFGFPTIARLTHGLESVLDAMRDNVLVANADIIDLLLRGTDAVQALLASITTGAPEPAIEGLLARCHAALATTGRVEILRGDTVVAAEAPPAPRHRWRIDLMPGRDVFRRGLDPMLALRELSEMGTVSSARCVTDALPALGELDPDSSYLGWQLELATDRPAADLEEVLGFVAEGGRIAITAAAEVAAPVAPPPEVIHAAAVVAAPPARARRATPEVIAALEVVAALATPAPSEPAPAPAPAPAAVPAPVPAPAPAAPPALSVVPPPAPAPAPAAAAPAAAPAARAAAAPARATPAEQATSIRVSVDKVDKLMNLVGELVINQSMVAQSVQDFTPDKLIRLQEAVAEMARNTRELQERVMAIRMVPVSTVFSRVPRLARDLAGQLGKRVEVELVGEDTELDKGVVERLADPLTHLVRNALDHGIEGPSDRVAAGKSPAGTLRLEAFHRGGSVIIEISDDGRGLDLARIRAKAIERGVIAAGEELSDAEVTQLIFAPGFSTAATVSDVSGRGVGMDVVKRNVVALNGSITIDNRPGKGAVFRIALPLTLAILDGLCLRAGEHVYVIPLTAIVESLRPRPDQLRRLFGRGEVLDVRNEIVPLVRLHDLFGIPDCITDPTDALVVLLEDQGRKIGLLVDDIAGQAQVVIKSLETHLHRVDGLMGATILGDGRVALILDVQRLVRARHSGDGAAYSHRTTGVRQELAS